MLTLGCGGDSRVLEFIILGAFIATVLGGSQAISRSLFSPTSLANAIERFGFVQADPIRAPARAQDLTLRPRVRGYRAGDLEAQNHYYQPMRVIALLLASCCIVAAQPTFRSGGLLAQENIPTDEVALIPLHHPVGARL